MEPSQGDRAWPRDYKLAYIEIPLNRDHYHLFSKTEFQKWGVLDHEKE